MAGGALARAAILTDEVKNPRSSDLGMAMAAGVPKAVNSTHAGSPSPAPSEKRSGPAPSARRVAPPLFREGQTGGVRVRRAAGAGSEACAWTATQRMVRRATAWPGSELRPE